MNVGLTQNDSETKKTVGCYKSKAKLSQINKTGQFQQNFPIDKRYLLHRKLRQKQVLFL